MRGSDRWRQLTLAVAVVLGFAALAASGERGDEPAPFSGLLGRAARVGFCLALLTGASLSSRQLYLRGQVDLAKTLVRLAWDGAMRKEGRA